ncbi:MAG: bifunctional DNA primase/polymerase, partial [Thermoanaerobaculia bacterium]|nr:bifunctional DNA primase/polymerase [Thermoanaerobaculia bacterium]
MTTSGVRSVTQVWHRGRLRDEALAYAQAGWVVLPLRPRGKAPLTAHGVKDATNDVQVIQSWWARWPDANIGLAIPGDLVVVDIDSREALHQIHAEGLDLPATVRTATARGIHLVYSTGSIRVGSRVGLLPGVDIRAAGSYVAVPPSIHPSGIQYQWEVELRRSSIAPCPDWLLEKLKQGVGPTQVRSSDDWAAKVKEVVPEGYRNQTFAEVAGLLFRKLPAEAAAELALCANVRETQGSLEIKEEGDGERPHERLGNAQAVHASTSGVR